MSHLVFFLEEASAATMLKAIVPQLVPEGISIHYYFFEGKQDLERRLEHRLRGWKRPDTRFIIMRDQDSADCRSVKSRLMNIITRSGKSGVCLVRIACHELESFYLGDLAAVEKAFPRCRVAKFQKGSLYRDPDNTTPNAVDQLRKLVLGGGVSYQKIGGSRAIAPYLDLSGKNTSTSFNMLIQGIQRLAGELDPAR